MVRADLLRIGYGGLRPLLFRAHGGNPEAIHEDTIRLLACLSGTPVANIASWVCGRPHDPVEVAGIQFPGRVGLAAGLDKDGKAARMWAHLGFSFAELGTVTASAQPGNPKPRVYRLVNSHGLINRMGFNNEGARALAARLGAWGVKRGENTLGIPLGVSIGKTKVVDLDDAVADYVASFRAVSQVADYVAVNVSSPNTPGLRQLQGSEHITGIVSALVEEAGGCDGGPLPIFVKMAPDLSDSEIDSLVEVVEAAGASGFIATNTTLARSGIASADVRWAGQSGGLSGAPLTVRAREVVERVVAHTSLPVIASGGIMTADDARAMLDIGAALVQVYTGFIYSGPALVAAINETGRK